MEWNWGWNGASGNLVIAAGKKGVFLLDRLCTVGQSGVCVRTLGGHRKGELCITRFLRNKRVTSKEMFATAEARTARLVKGRPILAIESLPAPERVSGGLTRGTRPPCVTEPARPRTCSGGGQAMADCRRGRRRDADPCWRGLRHDRRRPGGRYP